jgi:hypothetical protein
LRDHDLSLRDMATQFAKGASSVDGELLRSFRSVLTAPGTLTARHLSGERRKFVSPLTLFFVANAVFVATQAFTGDNTLSTPLHSHLNNQDWSGFARDAVQAKLSATHQTLAQYARTFDQEAIFNAKALMILMVLAFAPVAAAVCRTNDRAAGAHVVFALHLYSFVLALLTLALLLAQLQFLLGGDGLRSHAVDVALSLFNLLACGVYIHLALGPAYGARRPVRIVQTAILTVAVAAIFMGYRFAIFMITLATT